MSRVRMKSARQSASVRMGFIVHFLGFVFSWWWGNTLIFTSELIWCRNEAAWRRTDSGWQLTRNCCLLGFLWGYEFPLGSGPHPGTASDCSQILVGVLESKARREAVTLSSYQLFINQTCLFEGDCEYSVSSSRNTCEAVGAKMDVFVANWS